MPSVFLALWWGFQCNWSHPLLWLAWYLFWLLRLGCRWIYDFICRFFCRVWQSCVDGEYQHCGSLQCQGCWHREGSGVGQGSSLRVGRVGIWSNASRFLAVLRIRIWCTFSSTCEAWMFCNACIMLMSCLFEFSHININQLDDHSHIEWFSDSSLVTFWPNLVITSWSARHADSYSASHSAMLAGMSVAGIANAKRDLEK